MRVLRDWARWCVWAVVMAHSAAAQDGSLQGRTVLSRESLADQLAAQMPQSGGVHAVFLDEHGYWTCVGYEFGTEHWYFTRSDPSQQRLVGRDAEGHYSNDPIGAALVEQPDWGQGHSYRLDAYFPQIGLLTLLRDETVDAKIAKNEESGGWSVTFELPRGLRFPAADDLPNAEVTRWSGGGSVLRPAVYELDQNLAVLTYTYPVTPSRDAPRLRTREYDLAPESSEAFQVVSQSGGLRLSAFTLVPEGSQSFSRPAVFAQMRTRREGDRVRDRVPVVTAEYADAHPELRPTPIKESIRSIWLTGGAIAGAGLLAILLGIGAWLRHRHS